MTMSFVRIYRLENTDYHLPAFSSLHSTCGLSKLVLFMSFIVQHYCKILKCEPVS